MGGKRETWMSARRRHISSGACWILGGVGRRGRILSERHESNERKGDATPKVVAVE
jgi:hypothetical protein